MRCLSLPFLCLFLGTAIAQEDPEVERALKKAMRDIHADHCKELESLVKWCAKNGLKAEAEAQLAVMKLLVPDYKGLDKLQAEVSAASPVEMTDALKKDYDGRLTKANEKNAKDLFDLAKKCMKVGLYTRAFDLINSVMVADPDHKEARKILGYVYDKTEKAWITDWEAEMRKKHVLFGNEGWVLKKDLPKWEQGLRPFAGEWMTIEEEAKKRNRNDYGAWEVESEHFMVKTNLGRARAWEFCVLLEDYQRAFYRVFVGYYDQKAGATLLFNKSKEPKKHVVHLYPSRERYLTYVKAEHGNDDLLKNSAGFYSSSIQSSHFYWNEADVEDTLSTLYHEITHQLFAESKKNPGGGGSDGNNWVVEGIASYCETWVKRDGQWYPGENTAIDKMMTAKQFLSSSGFNLGQFVALDHDGFHSTNRGLNYSLACALSHFLMHYDDELYKEDFVRLISDYYAGKLKANALAEYTGVDLGTLQGQFVDYMKGLEIKK